jgi:hypothetical protein
MVNPAAKIRAEDVFNFSIIDELRDDIEKINLKYGGVTYYIREGFLTYSDYNIRHGGHGRRVVESLNRMFATISGGKRYLEIGCVDVPVLAFMAQHFDEIVLIEPNPYSREIANLIIDGLGVKHVSVIPSITSVDGEFDTIAAWECLEHVVSVDASIGAAQYNDYWQAKREFLGIVKETLTQDGDLFWSVPVMTGWVFAAKYFASLGMGRRYSQIDLRDAMLHLVAKTASIDKWIPASSHLGFNQKQFASLVREIFPLAEIEKLRGRKHINEHLYGHCRKTA